MRTLLSYTLISSLVLQPFAHSADMVTSGLTNVASALNTGTNFMQNITASQTQMQALVNQLNGAMNTNNVASSGIQSQFDAIKAQLAGAMAEAQLCVQNATKDYSKYKKAPVEPAELIAKIDEAPSCLNYGAIIDSIRKNNDQMRDTNTKMACFTNLQNKVKSIAESAKAPFNALTQAATEVYNTQTKIIDTHQSIVDNVDKSLNGEGGYKAQLNDLKKLSSNLSAAISAGSSGKPGDQGGIGARLRGIKRDRVDLANKWYSKLMSEVHTCFTQVPTDCGTGVATPADCIRGYAGNAGKNSPSERAQAAVNSAKVSTAFMLTGGSVNLIDQASNIDVSKPELFLEHSKKRFDQMVNAAVNNFRKQQFVGANVVKESIASHVRQKYGECYTAAVTRFDADMKSEGGYYKSVSNMVKDAEDGINFEIKSLIDQAQGQMNAFRTSFNKIYNRDLSQFAADCSATDSPYESSDCLRKLAVTLKGGIEGTVQSIKLDGGGVATFTPGPTTMALQTMTLDAIGQPTLTTTNTQCVGFDECINVLDRYQASHEGNKKSAEDQRKTFVQTHNKTVDTALATVAAQFTEMSKIVTAGINAINTDLDTFGVGATVPTENLAGEKLETDETTGLYKMPADMSLAMAGVGSLIKIGDTSSVTSAYNGRVETLNTKAKAAADMKSACLIGQGDITAIMNRIGTCDDKLCKGDRAARMISPLESLLRKSQVVATKEGRNDITNEYLGCVSSASRDARSGAREDRRTEIEIAALEKEAERNRQKELFEQDKQIRKEDATLEKKSCSESAMGSLEAMNQNSRDSMRGQNDAIIAAIRGITDACSAEPLTDDDISAAIAACETAKKTVNAATAPTDELETDVTGTATTEKAADIPFSRTAK